MSGVLKFCSECNNLLIPQEDSKRKRLMFVCRSCDHQEKLKGDKVAEECIVYRRDIHYQQKEKLLVRPEVIHDPTLSRTNEYRCNACTGNEAVFWQLPENQESGKMALIFVCTQCCAWRQQ